jgi:penicillin-insensitive murein endopeptidase
MIGISARLRPVFLSVTLVAAAIASTNSAAQDIAAQEAARRQAVLARLPEDAAQRVFGVVAAPSPGPARPIGSYSKGCLAGAIALPADGPGWQVMRPSRNRAWGDPTMIAVIERLAAAVPGSGWPGLLIGDIAQPRGGPMLTGHASHQLGLDADIWLTPMPPRRLDSGEREEMPAVKVVTADGYDVERSLFGRAHYNLIEAAARLPETERIFVNPAIKRELCREAGADRDWLRRVRPWWGHDDHLHLRIVCPHGDPQCVNSIPPAPPGDGCGKELDWWFTDEARHPKPHPPARPILVSDLPPACAALVGR